MSPVIEKFLRYVAYDTQSKDEQPRIPSTEKQRILADVLAEELKAMGAENVSVSQESYVYATIPATTNRNVPVLGLIAHMDTSPDASGKDVKPRIVENYDGGTIVLNQEKNITLSPADYPSLKGYAGDDLIVTDGTTLLGSDDKAGVAEIMAAAEYLLDNPQIPHGTIKIGFTPDEEVGCGADAFDVKGFGADVAYTVDGGALGELEYENFNAASGRVFIHGRGVHPGSAKNTMKNAGLMAMEFHSLLPAAQNPMYTEGYEGFFHLDSMQGEVEHAVLKFLIRDHDKECFQDKKDLMEQAAAYLNVKYPSHPVSISIHDSYYNMKEQIAPHMEIIESMEKAMRENGVEPYSMAVRGGTDGATLSFMGLPCPNICTGGGNAHSKQEYVVLEDMEIIKNIIKTAVCQAE